MLQESASSFVGAGEETQTNSDIQMLRKRLFHVDSEIDAMFTNKPLEHAPRDPKTKKVCCFFF